MSLDDLDTGEGESTGGDELDAALGELDTTPEEPAEAPSGSDDDFAELDLDDGDTGEATEATTEATTDSDASASEEPAEPAPEPASEAPAESASETAAGGESEAEPEAMGADDLLSEDDDFDFLGDSDENATKLDLAKAYIDMGDNDGARDILNEVLAEGTEGQQGEARELLAQVG